MSYTKLSTRAILSALLYCTLQLSAQAYTPQNTAVFVQGYHTLYANKNSRIISKCAQFLFNNPTLSKVIINPEFISTVRALWKKGSKLSEYYPAFDTHNTDGRIKAFAQRLLIEGKDINTTGTKAVQELLDKGFSVTVLIGNEEAHREAFLAAFPILKADGVTVIFDFEATEDSFDALKKLANTKHNIFVCGNKNHTSVLKAEEAGLNIKHYTDIISI